MKHAKQKQRPKQPDTEPAPRQEIPYFHPSPDAGLTAEQANRLARGGWDNHPVESPTKSDKQIIRENLLTYFNLIFVVLALCLLIVGDFKDMTFLLVVAANAVIGIVQQIRSKRAIEKLTLLSASRVHTIRDGSGIDLPVQKLVREDIVELSAGCQIPADGPVLTGHVQVNESLLTGEADPIPKDVGDILRSGSFIISGKCRARMDDVGPDAYAAKLTLAAKKDVGPGKSEMMRSLDHLIRFIGLVLIPIGGALFYNQFAVQHLPFRRAIVSTVAALVGMIPEGLFLLTSVALAVSVLRLARGRVLIHEMNAIETLARVDVLCVDKTGTVTAPEMAVREVVPLDVHAWTEQDIGAVIGAFYHAMDPDNDTARALAEKFPDDPGWKPQSVVPFSSAVKWSAVNFAEQGAFVLGAPECVLGEDVDALQARIHYYAEKGCRVLLLAQCDRAEEGQLHGLVLPMALLVLENPIRPNAPKTFSFFQEQGVDVKVISGDDPVTVSAVAHQAGIPGAVEYVDARTLKTDEELARAARSYTVFGRVTPDQKRKLVRALQNAGHTVAMTGDGVNDVLALKDADCGVAMASGADAACQVAQLVLLDSDFSAMPRVVAEGRRVINNIQRAAALYLVKNILSFFLALVTLFAHFPYPFVPIQLTLISGLTIGLPSFFLALEPNHDLVKGKFLHNVFRRAFPGGLTAIFVILFAEFFAFALDFSVPELSSICVILMAINGILVIYYAARPLDWKRRLLLISMSTAVVLAVTFFGDLFSMARLHLGSCLVLMALAMLVIPIQMGLEHLFDWCSALLERYHAWIARRMEAHQAFRDGRRVR